MKRLTLIAAALLLSLANPSSAQVSIGIGLPNVSIGINVPVFPELVRVPGYPVYYAPGQSNNLFFYDGMYWVYQDESWYASTWFDGPWGAVSPHAVPLYVLRVPVRYYRHPPDYFSVWRADAPPQWGEHWGPAWANKHRGWDRWNRSAAPAPAPRPTYQRPYSAERYPQPAQQRELHDRNYRYQPREAIVRQQWRGADARPNRNDDRGKDRSNESGKDRDKDKGRDKDEDRRGK